MSELDNLSVNLVKSYEELRDTFCQKRPYTLLQYDCSFVGFSSTTFLPIEWQQSSAVGCIDQGLRRASDKQE